MEPINIYCLLTAKKQRKMQSKIFDCEAHNYLVWLTILEVCLQTKRARYMLHKLCQHCWQHSQGFPGLLPASVHCTTALEPWDPLCGMWTGLRAMQKWPSGAADGVRLASLAGWINWTACLALGFYPASRTVLPTASKIHLQLPLRWFPAPPFLLSPTRSSLYYVFCTFLALHNLAFSFRLWRKQQTGSDSVSPSLSPSARFPHLRAM